MILSSLSIGYQQTLVSGINQTLMPGTFVCLIGRNGTGKSTLLKTLAGLIPPLAGELWLEEGQPYANLRPADLARQVGLVLTQFPDLANTTLRQLVAYGRLPYTSWLGRLHADDLLITDQAIARLGISHLAHRPLYELSDGERQKAMIARALAQGTRYLLLDEPSAFLDHESRLELMELLRLLAHEEKKAILLSTHDHELAFRYADLLWEVRDRQLHIFSPSDTIKTSSVR